MITWSESQAGLAKKRRARSTWTMLDSEDSRTGESLSALVVEDGGEEKGSTGRRRSDGEFAPVVVTLSICGAIIETSQALPPPLPPPPSLLPPFPPPPARRLLPTSSSVHHNNFLSNLPIYTLGDLSGKSLRISCLTSQFLSPTHLSPRPVWPLLSHINNEGVPPPFEVQGEGQQREPTGQGKALRGQALRETITDFAPSNPTTFQARRRFLCRSGFALGSYKRSPAGECYHTSLVCSQPDQQQQPPFQHHFEFLKTAIPARYIHAETSTSHFTGGVVDDQRRALVGQQEVARGKPFEQPILVPGYTQGRRESFARRSRFARSQYTVQAKSVNVVPPQLNDDR